MGNFFKSLSKELGKNTGKYVSNKIFGDNHATPYKIIKQEERSERRFEREKLREEKNYQKKIEKEENRKIREESRVFREQELEERRLLTANKKRLREEEINAKRSEIEARKIINQDKKTQKEAEIEFNRWLREQKRIEKLEDEEAQQNEHRTKLMNNEKEVASFNEYVNSLVTIHRNLSYEINWNDLICENENFVETFKNYYLNNIHKSYSTLTKEYAIMHLCWQIACAEYDYKTKEYVTKEEELEWFNIIKTQNLHIDINEFNKVLRVTRDESIKSLDSKWLYEECINALKNQPLFWKLKTIHLLKKIAQATKESDFSISPNERNFIIKVISSLKLPEEIYKTALHSAILSQPEIMNLACFGGIEFEKLIEENLTETRPTVHDSIFLTQYPDFIASSQKELVVDTLIDENSQLYLDLFLLASRDAKNLLDHWNKNWSLAYRHTEQKAILNHLAKGIINEDKNVYRAALEVYPIYDIIADYGSSINTTFFDEGIEIDFFVNLDEVIPRDKKLLSRNGEISIHPYTNTERNLITQDYVCSMILRIARETFNLYSFDKLIIHAIQNSLNNSTGNNEDITIVSILLKRSELNNVNFNLVDPSDCLSYNFECRMDFNKSKGFSSVKNIPNNLLLSSNNRVKPLKESNKNLLTTEKVKSINIKGLKQKSITIKNNMVVSELKSLFKKLFEVDLVVFTTSGNIAGDNRKLKALSDTIIKSDLSIRFKEFDQEYLISEIKNKLGISINFKK
jgi:hypothetical protein